jgi:uncharacterized membrane protein
VGMNGGYEMTQDDGGYDVKPLEKPAAAPTDGAAAGSAPAPAPVGVTTGGGGGAPKPGEPGFVPPVPIIEKADGTEEAPVDPDVEKNRGMAILAYICFIIPLLTAPKSKFARFHANQGLLSFVYWCVAIIGVVALTIIKDVAVDRLEKKFAVLYGFFTCLIYLVEPALLLAGLALMLYGIIQAANGEKKHLPLIGQITLIK